MYDYLRQPLGAFLAVMAALCLLDTPRAQADFSCPPELTVTLRADGLITLDGRKDHVSGDAYGYNDAVDPSTIAGGDVVCVKNSPSGAGYGLRLRNLAENQGVSPQSPITFVNGGEQVVFNGGGDQAILVDYGRYLRISGSGADAHCYGFLIDGSYRRGVKFANRSSDFELDHVEIANVSMIGIQSTPRSNCSDASRPQGQTWNDMYDYDGDGFYQKGRVMEDGSIDPGDLDDVVSQDNFTLENPVFHDNYIHDTGNEAMYIGSNLSNHLFHADGTRGPAMGDPVICNYTDEEADPPIFATGEDDPLSPKQTGVRIYSNRIERIGWDAINVKSSARDCAVYDNVVSDFGLAGVSDQSPGINLVPDVDCDVYRNRVERGQGSGIYSMGVGGLIAGNLVIEAGQGGSGGARSSGIEVVRSSAVPAELYDGYDFRIVNNTVVLAKSFGVRFSVPYGNDHSLLNNLVVETLEPDPGGKDPHFYVSGTSLAHDAANLWADDVDDATVAFRDPGGGDYRPSAASSATVDQGVDAAVLLAADAAVLGFDLAGFARPQAGAFDVGAYELPAAPAVPLCPSTARDDCSAAVINRITLRDTNEQGRGRRLLVWKWRRGGLAAADLGDPTYGSGYAICVYEGSEPATMLTAATILARPPGDCGTKDCWRASSGRLRYSDPEAVQDGIAKLDLRASETAKAGIAAKGAGQALSIPDLPLQLPLLVQIVNAPENKCWESRWEQARKNEAGRFKAR